MPYINFCCCQTERNNSNVFLILDELTQSYNTILQCTSYKCTFICIPKPTILIKCHNLN